MKANLVCLVLLVSCHEPPAAPKIVDEVSAAAARVDAALNHALEEQEKARVKNGSSMPALVALPQADDATFLRRVCVDLAGRLPTASELEAYLEDASSDKRRRKIDQLSQEAAAGEGRFRRMADALRVTDSVLGVSQQPYIDWLRAAFREDRPWPQLVTELLTAQGSLRENPATGFLLRDFGCAQVTATESARAFLGEDIHCAACHDHPYHDATQRSYHEFAAFFSVTRDRGEKVPHPKPATPLWQTLAALAPAQAAAAFERLELAESPVGWPLPSRYLYRDAKPGQIMEPRFLFLASPGLAPTRPASLRADSTSRAQLAREFTDSSHARLAKVAALRVWSWMFGSPFLAIPQEKRMREGPDTHPTPQDTLQQRSCDGPISTSLFLSPSSNDWLSHDSWGLVTVLEAEFQRCGQRLGEFQRILAHTQAYQRQAMAVPQKDGLGRYEFLPSPLVRRLPAAVVWDALVSYLPEEQRRGERAESAHLPQVCPIDHPLRILGQGSREWADESMPTLTHQLARLMIAHPLLENVTRSESALVSTARVQSDPAKQVDQLFLATLGRRAEASERQAALTFVQEHKEAETALPHLAWSLLNTREFLFHH